jgi:phytanoyl-CoA hydroxylase
LNETNFRYTVDNPLLTLEQRKFYEENGFILIKKVVSPKDISIFRDRFIEIANSEEASPDMLVMRDVKEVKLHGRSRRGEIAITKIQNFQDDETLRWGERGE